MITRSLEPSNKQHSTFSNETKRNDLTHPKMKKLTIAAVVAIASQAFAEPMPYRPAKAFLSAREIFGLDRRDTDVYHPKQSVCGVAATCSEAVRRFLLLLLSSFMETNMLVVWRLLRAMRFHRWPDALL